ncbi:MAG: 2-amino-4-hydroxy-6-hydroxymethyldihydropteridine diphosphokinase [Alloprevotella sp.]|nr:2-amino-4-hydroxy-6-hydroxymethyldihydropteridine diphosphokinase [Prevotella sp.]MBR1712757.1 2-amino-4-hydroxy-6-hydroxymethyldihydropteridine diphosphokinase [Alloprevotella sp.]
MPEVYIGLGSNLGDREWNIRHAVGLLEARIGRQTKLSGLYETKPSGFRSDHDFLNAVAAFETTLSPVELLDITQQIERELGRTRKSRGGIYHDRTIDIDLLYMENIRISTPGLTLPHPRAASRAFVMEPLAEIAPDVAGEIKRSATPA